MTDEREMTCATCGGEGVECPDCCEDDSPCCDNCGETLEGEGYERDGETVCAACRPCCDCCTEVLEDDGQEFGDETYCSKCYATETFECPECNERFHNDDKTNRGWCPDCRDTADTDLQSELDDLFGDDKGHLIRAALVAAGLLAD
jgi:hypothetical protein